MPDAVRTITIDGKEHILADGVEVTIKFSDGYGGHFDTSEAAAKNKAINDAQALIQDAINWTYGEFDMPHVLDNRAELIDALQRIGN